LVIKQLEADPWTTVAERYAAGSVVEGRVRKLTDFGAFIEIEEGIDGLVHVSDLSWTKRVKHPSEVLKKGDDVEAIITSIDQENRRISLSIKEFQPNDWQTFKQHHQVGDVVEGAVTRVADFGIFVQIDGLVEGLMHVSETPLGRGEKPQEHYKEGDSVRVRILRIDDAEMKIGLSALNLEHAAPEEAAPAAAATVIEEPRAVEEPPSVSEPAVEEPPVEAPPESASKPKKAAAGRASEAAPKKKKAAVKKTAGAKTKK
ncbi:MAG TPA: S1 RNA-binding domain-containing protein, partial [Thermoanaerobaculia bacterium]